jgi:multisubunit Na+/H+ antiporter MnhE subunit
MIKFKASYTIFHLLAAFLFGCVLVYTIQNFSTEELFVGIFAFAAGTVIKSRI